jgi:hypothetical protein
METNINITNLTSADNGSLLTCRAVQAEMGKFVTTTVKLVEQGENETYLKISISNFFSSDSDKLSSTFGETPLNYTLTSSLDLISEVEHKEGTELKIDADVNKQKQKYKDHNKSSNTILDHQKLEGEAKYRTSATTNRESLLDEIIIGVCVLIVLYELIVIVMIVIGMMRGNV